MSKRPIGKGLDVPGIDVPEFKPYDEHVEERILASIMLDNRLLSVAMSILEPSDFNFGLHQRVFELMMIFDEDERRISPITLAASLKNDREGESLAKIMRDDSDGWKDPADRVDLTPEQAIRSWLVESARVATTYDAHAFEEMCRVVVELRERRQAKQAATDALDGLWRGDQTLDALTGMVEVADAITLRQQHQKGSASSSAAFETLARDVEKATQGGKLPGVTTGLYRLDRVLGGFMPSDFIVVAGRPGMGKSVAGAQFAQSVGRLTDDHGQREYDPMIFSLEMTAKENVARMIAELDYDDSLRMGREPLHYSKIIKGRLSQDEFERFVLLGGMLREYGVEIFDESRMTMQKISSLARARAQVSPRKPFVVIDHLHIVGAGATYRGNRLEELTEISGQSKALAKRLNCPVVGLAQLSRSVESRDDKRPLLSDLRESGSIEQDADAVLFLYRPEYYLRRELRHAQAKKAKNAVDLEIAADQAKGKLEINVEKNRSGGVGDVHLHIDVAANAIRDKKPEPGDGAPAQLALDQRYRDPLDDLERRTGQ